MKPGRGRSWSAWPRGLMIAYYSARAAAVKNGSLGSRFLAPGWWAEVGLADTAGYMVIVADVRIGLRWTACSGFISSADWRLPDDLGPACKEIARNGRALPERVARGLYPFVAEKYRK
jgi:hypothetical protein